MRTHNLLQTLAIAAICTTGALGVPSAEPSLDAAAAFNRLKTLEGSWVSAGTSKSTTRFELTGGGSVLVEHYSNPALPDNGHMMSAYHLDGSALVLTHYCIARNQPTLRADRFDATKGEIQFEFLRATNLATPGTGHMRRAMYRLESADRFTTSWEFFENGVKKMTETETFTRVK
jgi:hypothetical protein